MAGQDSSIDATNNAVLMEQFEALLNRVVAPLERRIGELETQISQLATRKYVEEKINPVKAASAQALAASSAAASEAQEAQTRMTEQETRFDELMHKMEEIVSRMENTVSNLAGRLEATAQLRDERIDSVEKQGERRDNLITAQGNAIGELNKQAAVADERRVQLEKATSEVALAASKIAETNSELKDTLQAIQSRIEQPGPVVATAIKAKDFVAANWRLISWAMIIAALAILALTVGPEFVRDLLKTLGGIK